MSNVVKIAIAAVLALVIGLAVGFFVGRATLEAKWSQPYAALSPERAKQAAAPDADPSPSAGTRVLAAMPIGKARAVLANLTGNDPAACPTASFGQGEEGLELHVTVENRGKCTIKSAAGVAYGFDPHGRSAAANKGGEHFVAFRWEGLIEPGKHGVAAQKLRYAENATLAVAHVDELTCTDGSSWKRP